MRWRAPTDETLMHLAYARYPAARLRAGVQLFELSLQRVTAPFIDGPALAVQLKTLIDIDWLHSAYALRLAANGSCCEWVIRDNDGSLVMTLEPD